MDNETLDRLGATPLADGLKRIADINTSSDLFTELARLHVEDVRCVRDKRVRRFCVPGGVANHRLFLHSVLFYFGSRIDPDQPNINIAALGQVNLTALTRLSPGTNQYVCAGAGRLITRRVWVCQTDSTTWATTRPLWPCASSTRSTCKSSSSSQGTPAPPELAATAERCRQWHLTNDHLCSQTEIQPSNVLRVETQLASIFIPRTDLRYLVLFPPCVWRAYAWDCVPCSVVGVAGIHTRPTR